MNAILRQLFPTGNATVLQNRWYAKHGGQSVCVDQKIFCFCPESVGKAVDWLVIKNAKNTCAE